ncbi:hypothetical protein BDR04DRAFT_1156285 [Suillus decipiens]|nr:hypothetical protein BDR04DRAFT_1156285 [Suillus decipiens]
MAVQSIALHARPILNKQSPVLRVTEAKRSHRHARSLLVLPRSGPEPRFEPDFWSGSPWFGPWFSCQPEPDRKAVLGSGYIPKQSGSGSTFPNLPEPNPDFDFDFNYDDDGVHVDVKILSSRLVSQATVSLFEDIYLLQSVCFLDPPPAVKSNGSPCILLLWVICLTMSEDCCALNPDGSLKDASGITFFNDPDDEVPLPQVSSFAQPSSSTTSTKDAFSVLLKAGHTPATVTAGSWHSGQLLEMCSEG